MRERRAYSTTTGSFLQRNAFRLFIVVLLGLGAASALLGGLNVLAGRHPDVAAERVMYAALVQLCGAAGAAGLAVGVWRRRTVVMLARFTIPAALVSQALAVPAAGGSPPRLLQREWDIDTTAFVLVLLLAGISVAWSFARRWRTAAVLTASPKPH
jgi:hypothetical protein